MNGPGGFFVRALRYGYITLMDDMASVLAFAFLCSGLIAVAIPESFFETPLAQGFPALLIMLLAGIPFYVCATASTPIAAMLILKGLSPGAALVFLLAGPATNLGSLFVLSKYMGKRFVGVYLACIAAVTLFLGAAADSIYRDTGLDAASLAGSAGSAIPATVQAVAAVLFLALLVRSAWVTDVPRRWGENLRRLCRPLHFDPLGTAGRAIAVLIVLLAYASTAFSVVGVGETGWVLRFGKVVRELDRPGLCVHLPWPVDAVKTCRPAEVRTLQFGFERHPADASGRAASLAIAGRPATERELEAEVMTGEESLVSIKYSVHYALADPYRYVFHAAEPDLAVQAFSESALRAVCSRLDTDQILVGHRPELEAMVRFLLQEEVAAAGIGVEVAKVTLLDVHAPPAVHYAFRDVASAGEDKDRKALQAESVYKSTVALARGKAYRILEEAMIYAEEKTFEACGRTAAFSSLAAAWAENPHLMKLRLFLETMERILARAETILPLAKGIDVELWMNGSARRLPFLESGAGRPGAAGKEAEAPPAEAEDQDFLQRYLDRAREEQEREQKKAANENPFREFMKER